MANVGRGPKGYVYTGKLNLPPSFLQIGTGSGLTANGMLIANGDSPFTVTAAATNGQVIIGSSGGAPAFATITSTGGSIAFTAGPNTLNMEAGAAVPTTFTADSGIATPALNNLNVLGGVNCTTTGSGSTITVDVQGIGTTWIEVTGTSVSAAVNTGYILNNAGLVTVNLPGTCAVGDEIRLAGKGAGFWVADAPAGDTIHFGNQDTSSGGTITATNRYDCLHLLCTVANSEWTVLNSLGNLTVA